MRWRPKIFPKKPTEVRQELHCHACDSWVQFLLDMSLDGNHVLECPKCGHEHCRVVRRGKITDIRWDQRNGPTYQVAFKVITVTTSSTYTNLYNIYHDHSTASHTFTWGNT
jgi:hypothetical protein